MAQIKLLSIVNGRPTGHAAADSQITVSGLTLNGGGAEVTSVDADLSALGPNLTILGGMEKGEALVGADYRDRPDFWRLS